MAEKTTPSPNKKVVCCFRVLAETEPRLLPMAGRGGEERKRWVPAVVGGRGGQGVASLASVRIAEGWPALVFSSSASRPAYRGGEGARAVVRR
jgi:hypothetical protein